MVLVLLAAIVFCGLRLAGVTDSIYKAFAHIYVGGLGGYALASYEWLTILSFVLMVATELYAVAAKYFPAIALPSLIKKL